MGSRWCGVGFWQRWLKGSPGVASKQRSESICKLIIEDPGFLFFYFFYLWIYVLV